MIKKRDTCARAAGGMRLEPGAISLLGLLLIVAGLASGVLELALAGLIMFVPSMIALFLVDTT